MSFEAVGWALRDAPATKSTQVILIALAERAGGDYPPFEAAFPAQKTLAREAQVSVATVKRALKDLEDRGVIYRGNQNLPQVRGFHKEHRPVVWNLNQKATRHAPETPETPAQNDPTPPSAQNEPRCMGDTTPSSPMTPPSAHSYELQTSLERPYNAPSPLTPHGEAADAAEGDQQVLDAEIVNESPAEVAPATSQQVAVHEPTPKAPAKKAKKAPKFVAREYTPEFETFWKAYPNGTGKAKAFDLWQEILAAPEPITTAPEMIYAAQMYAAYLAAIGKLNFSKHATTWLNGQHWEDQLTIDANQQMSRAQLGQLPPEAFGNSGRRFAP